MLEQSRGLLNKSQNQATGRQHRRRSIALPRMADGSGRDRDVGSSRLTIFSIA